MKRFSLHEPLLNGNEKSNIGKCIDTSWLSSSGNFVSSFDSLNFGRIGHIHDNQTHFYRNPLYRHTHASEFYIKDLKHLSKVAILYAHVGIDHHLVQAFIEHRFDGVISAGLGMGYQPSNVHQSLIDAATQGLKIVRCSRVSSGAVTAEPNVDLPHQFIAAGSLNPQKARILLALSLTKTSNSKKIQDIFKAY